MGKIVGIHSERVENNDFFRAAAVGYTPLYENDQIAEDVFREQRLPAGPSNDQSYKS